MLPLLAPPLPPGCPWSGFTPPNVNWCEAERCAAIVNPSDAWSNLLYLLLGLWMWRVARREHRADLARFGPASVAIAVFSFGWAINVPVVTLMVLDLHPARRGMASSLQSCVASVANGLVAGVVAPLVMGSTVAMSAMALAMLVIGLAAWLYLRQRWPETVRHEG